MIKNNKFVLFGIMSMFLFIVAFVGSATKAEAYTQIGAVTLKVGSTGANVRALQELLASDPVMYPSGSQDGVFGPQTKRAVIQFQLAYNLTPDGIVGPMTRNKVNSIVLSGRGIDVASASIYGLALTSSGKNKIVSFSSSEPVKTTVFYDTNLINWSNWNDAEITLATPAISGTKSSDDTFSTNKQLTLSDTSANTKYNYTITTTDQSGNTSVIWPSTFQTNQ